MDKRIIRSKPRDHVLDHGLLVRTAAKLDYLCEAWEDLSKVFGFKTDFDWLKDGSFPQIILRFTKLTNKPTQKLVKDMKIC